MRPTGVIIGIIGLGQAGNVWNDWIVGIIVFIVSFSMVYAATVNGIISGIVGHPDVRWARLLRDP